MDPFRGERIAKLANHPAWPDLLEEISAAENDFWDSVARKLKAGQPLDPQEIETKRAYYRGMREVTQFPDKGAKAIAKHLERGSVNPV